jgi:hypothetical protein
MTTIAISGKQGTQSTIQWADNNDPMKFEIDLRIRLDNGTVVHAWFSMLVHSDEYTRPQLAEAIASHIRSCLTSAGVSPADAAKMCSADGGTSVHVDNTNPQDQPNGGGTPDAPISIDHGSDAPVTLTSYIS